MSVVVTTDTIVVDTLRLVGEAIVEAGSEEDHEDMHRIEEEKEPSIR